jgi:AcrR family transcriptional regulator
MRQSVEAGGGRARERILRAARRMFYERGIRAVGVEAIVTAAGVTKMSLYRHFASKDELVAACLAERIESYWRKWDDCIAPHPGDPVARILALLDWLGRRSTEPGFRGCPMTNAAVEFPEPGHPGRKLAETHKHELRQRLLTLATEAGAREAETLADGLLLLFEGSYASSQTFGADGPARAAVSIGRSLLEAHGCGGTERARLD